MVGRVSLKRFILMSDFFSMFHFDYDSTGYLILFFLVATLMAHAVFKFLYWGIIWWRTSGEDIKK